MEAISRRNALASGDQTKQRNSQDVTTSRAMVLLSIFMLQTHPPPPLPKKYDCWWIGISCHNIFTFNSWPFSTWIYGQTSNFCHKSQQRDADKGNMARPRSSSRKATVPISSNGPTSGELGESRANRFGSNGIRHAANVQRLQQGTESRPTSRTRPSASRGIRDDHIRSFELLSLRQ